MTCAKIRSTSVADPGEGPGGGGPSPLFLYQTEPQRAENMFLRPPLPYLRVWMNASQ